MVVVDKAGPFKLIVPATNVVAYYTAYTPPLSRFPSTTTDTTHENGSSSRRLVISLPPLFSSLDLDNFGIRT